MKWLFTIVWFVFLYCPNPLALSHAQVSPGPSMVLPERSHDFKEVEEGEVVEHTFKVLNKGDQPLEIMHVNPG